MSILDSLNPQQRLAVETTAGPVLILAGAGTGKTRVITHRIARMIQKGIRPGNILGVTFTNKAAREMLERFNQLVGRKPQARGTGNSDAALSPADLRPTLCTFHALGLRVLRQHVGKLGYKPNFVMYKQSEQFAVLKRILSRISAPAEPKEPGVLLPALSRIRSGASPAAASSNPSVAALAEHIRPGYEAALRACNAVDFDDLILLPLRLFKEHPGTLAACRTKYRYVMVDEYQDTNAAQFQLVYALTQEHRNLCVVGDDDQSIYGWRGAEIANLLDMEAHFPEVKVIKLEQNYRSTNTILAAANALVKNNARRRGKQLWSARGHGTKITLHTVATEEDEARTIVQEIEFLRHARRVPWSDQAVLFRVKLQSRPLEAALRQAGVRYHLVGGQSFFDRREVRDFLAYLKLLLNPNDDVSLLRIANVPARGLSDGTMSGLLAASLERHCSVFGAMNDPQVRATFPAKAREGIESFVRLVERTRTALAGGSPGAIGTGAPETAAEEKRQPQEKDAQPGSGVSPHTSLHAAAKAATLREWAKRFLAEIGYLDELRRSEKDAEAAENRVRNLLDLIGSMDDPTGSGGAPGSVATSATERLQLFLEGLALDRDRDEDPAQAGEAVTLITVHSCKGLEFPHVYIVGLEGGLVAPGR